MMVTHLSSLSTLIIYFVFLLYDLSIKIRFKYVFFFLGTGASCIYPLLAAKKFKWSMVGTDINKESIKNANDNIKKNNLQDLIQGNYNYYYRQTWLNRTF